MKLLTMCQNNSVERTACSGASILFRSNPVILKIIISIMSNHAKQISFKNEILCIYRVYITIYHQYKIYIKSCVEHNCQWDISIGCKNKPNELKSKSFLNLSRFANYLIAIV